MSHRAKSGYRADYEEADQRITDVPFPAALPCILAKSQEHFQSRLMTTRAGTIFPFVLLCVRHETKGFWPCAIRIRSTTQGFVCTKKGRCPLMPEHA
jgi:hypothetical protein